MNVWVGWLPTQRNLDQEEKNKTHIFSTGKRFLLNARSCKPQVGHSCIQIRRYALTGCYFCLNGSKFEKIHARKKYHGFIFYPNSEEQKGVLFSKMGSVSILPFSVFIGHGWLQHTGAEFIPLGNFSFSIYLFSDDMPFHGSII